MVRVYSTMVPFQRLNGIQHLVTNTLSPRQSRAIFPDGIFKSFFYKCVLNGCMPVLVKIMAWCWAGDKPLFELILALFTDTAPLGFFVLKSILLTTCPRNNRLYIMWCHLPTIIWRYNLFNSSGLKSLTIYVLRNIDVLQLGSFQFWMFLWAWNIIAE